MQQLTIRGFDSELENRLRRTAQALNLSLNKAAIYLMRKGAGLASEEKESHRVGDSVDHLIGTWSTEEAAEFHLATKDFDQIDEDLWR